MPAGSLRKGSLCYVTTADMYKITIDTTSTTASYTKPLGLLPYTMTETPSNTATVLHQIAAQL